MRRIYYIQQLDKKLAKSASIMEGVGIPKQGWIKTLRTTLGMTAAQLAKRLGVHRERLHKIEAAEQEYTLKLSTLKRAAEALDCDLYYVFIPKKNLLKMVEERAEKIASDIVSATGYHMSLESQTGEALEAKQQIQLLAQELLSGNLKRLWEDED